MLLVSVTWVGVRECGWTHQGEDIMLLVREVDDRDLILQGSAHGVPTDLAFLWWQLTAVPVANSPLQQLHLKHATMHWSLAGLGDTAANHTWLHGNLGCMETLVCPLWVWTAATGIVLGDIWVHTKNSRHQECENSMKGAAYARTFLWCHSDLKLQRSRFWHPETGTKRDRNHN